LAHNRLDPRLRGDDRRHSPDILVFKNTSRIEKICHENNWNLLNPSSKLADEIEQKISQIKWAGSLKKYFPDYQIKQCKDIVWNGKKIIIQFNQSHTGSGTILIKSKKQLEELKLKFPKRLARTAKYIIGPLFTNNNIVWKNKVLLGNINYQITGLKHFTDVKFATIGNDWALPHKILNEKQILQYKKITLEVGKKMRKSGWKGVFGIDVVMDEKNGKMYLLEINARQPASTTYESELQSYNIGHVAHNKKMFTTFQAHLASLLKLKYNNEKLIEIKNGAQIIYRVKNEELRIKNYVLREIKKYKFKAIQYNNTKPNSDLLRIQSKDGIMSKHNTFNKIGKKIKSLCHSETSLE
jgi:hypothetical protein